MQDTLTIHVEPDAQLAERARAGDHDAFALIMRRHNRRLYRIARSIVGDDAEAEEVVQEAYCRAFVGLGGFRADASLATWLSRIAANEALMRLRRRRPTATLDEIDARPAALGWLGPFGLGTPEAAAAQGEIRHLLESAIDRLPPNFRAVFVLRAVEQLSVEEAAAALDIPKDTVKTRYHRARRLLRRDLGRRLAAILDDAFPFAGARCDRVVEAVLRRIGATTPQPMSSPKSEGDMS
jgi:RNA polymerase sigma-70 factor (ECF subfamily)